MKFNQRWVCPRCGASMLAGAPGKLIPPTCRMGHPPCEMEQKVLPRKQAT